ncbi:hypothetical protein [Microbacterium sp. Leaf151]|nr:hypothetical protein [Microbacterium sp. Leaf151]
MHILRPAAATSQALLHPAAREHTPLRTSADALAVPNLRARNRAPASTR